MKTHYLFLTLAATLLLGSCAKEVTSDNSSSAKPEENGQMTIRATLADGQDTKTVLNGDGSVFWQPGDQIAVFFNSVKVPFTAYNNVNAASALFVGNSYITTGHNENSNGEVGNEYSYWGLYPYCDVTRNEFYQGGKDHNYERGFNYYFKNVVYFWRYDMYEFGSFMYNEELYYGEDAYDMVRSPGICDGSKISTRLFHWQKGVANTFDRYLNIAVAKSNDYKELSFYNVLGGVRFSVNADNITRVTFRGNNGEALAGDLVIGMNAQGRPEVTDIQHPEKTITVSLADDKPFVPGVWYYALMAPTQLTQGYTMELYTATAKAVKTVTSPVEVKRSVFGSLSEIDNGLSFSEPVVYPRALDSYTVGPYTPINPDEWIYWTFSGNTIFLREGYQLKIAANPTPINCTFPAKYESYRPEIASISEEGILTAIRPGETEIFCLVDDQEYVLHVKVFSLNSCFSLSVRPASEEWQSSIYVGETLSLVAIPDPADCPTAPVWTSSDENVATVNSEGVVTGIAPGSVTITADIAGTSGSYSVSVLGSDQARNVKIQVPEDVNLYELYPGVQIQLTAVIDPESYTGPVTWTSANTSVAVVDEKGLVTCVGEGDTDIRVTVQGANGEESDSKWIRVEPFILDALNYYKDGQEVSLEGYLVYASNLTGFVIGDDDETYRRTFAHVYQGDSPAVAVRPGDIVNVKGLKSTFHGGVEISGEGLSVEVLSSGNAVPEVSYSERYSWDSKYDWEKVRPIRAEGYLRRMSNTMYILYSEQWTDSPWIYLGHNDTAPSAYVYEKVKLTGFSLFPATDGTDIIDLNNMMIDGIDCEEYHAPASVKEVLENGVNGNTYRVKGTVSSIANTNYGNFYIKDASTDATLSVYGTKSWVGSYPKDIEGGWDSFGIVAGSEVEVFGERTTYGDVVELKDVRIVSVKN